MSDLETIPEKDIFDEAKDRLEIAVAAESENRQEAKYDLRFREGDQWDDNRQSASASDNPIELTINLTDAMCVRVVNNIKQQRPRGKCHPVGDGADINVAEVINGIGRHVETRSEASIAYDNAADLAATMGWGYWRIISEYVAPDSFDQDLRILPIFNPFTVYLDPTSVMPTGADADWCLISTKMKRKEYQRLYPNAENKGWSGDNSFEATGDWEDREEIRIAEYFRLRHVKQDLFLLKDAKGNQFTRYQEMMPSEESMKEFGLYVVEKRESSIRKLEWFRLNGSKVIDRKTLPGSYIPVIRVQGNARNIDSEIMRRGMVRSMRDPQRMVNYGEVAKIKRLGLAPQSPWVAAEGQLDGHPEWENANREPVPVLIYKPTTVQTDQGEVVLPPPQRQPPAQIEAGFAEFVQGMRNNLMAVAGMPNEPNIDAQPAMSGRAIQKRQFLSDQSHYQYYDNLTLAIAQTWRIMLEWIPHYFTADRMQRIIGEDGVPSMVPINQREVENGVVRVKNDLTVGRYDVVMDTGPGYETKREEGAESMMELLATPLGQIVASKGSDLIIRAMDFPYTQELADRIAVEMPDGIQKLMEQLPDRAKALVQTLVGQTEQLKKALQEAQMEIKTGLSKEQLRAASHAHDTEIRAKSAAHDTAVRAHTDIAKSEIAAGAQLLNSRAESERHQAAADQMIRNAETAGR